MKKRGFSRAGTLIILFLLACQADAQSLMESVSGINDLFYGVAAGVASLMLVFQAVKWKTAECPAERQAAKKGMFTVLMALVVVILAGTAVETMYGNKSGDENYIVKITTSSRITTTRRTTTTSTTTSTSTTTTTTTTLPYLTAMNVANCINDKNGFLVSNAEGGCGNCIHERDNVFGKATDGPGAYMKLRKWDPPDDAPPCSGCSQVPGWCTTAGHAVACLCNTLSQLNIAYGCGLSHCKPGYTYYDCNGNPISCP